MNQKIRMVVILLFSFLIIESFLCNLIQAAEKKAKERLAVLELNAKHGVEKSFAEALSVIVRDKLHSFGDYQVMSQEDIKAVASREQIIQAIGADEEGSKYLVDFGRAIGTRFMVAGDISKLGTTYTVSLRMLDTKGAEAGVTNRVNESCSKCAEDELIVTVQNVAAKLVGKPTLAAAKKAEEEAKKLTEEKKKAEELEKQRLAEERRKIGEAEKQRVAAEIEKLNQEKKQILAVAEQKRIAELLRKEDESTLRIANDKEKQGSMSSTSIVKPATAPEVRGSTSTAAKKAEEEKVADQRITSTVGPVVGGSSLVKTFSDPKTGMEFVLLPSGCFLMGDTFGDGDLDEKPVHEVCIDAFYMGKYEVTQGQYQTVTGNNLSKFQKGDNYPVEKASWNDVQSFIRSLNGKSGRKYRLPTEAEWEYAARSGGRSEKYAGGNDIDAVAWYSRNSGASTNPVGQKQPTGPGLYDMSGNVREWCGDWYDSGYYGNSPRNNPEGSSSGSDRVVRGGSWGGGAVDARATSRFAAAPGFVNVDLGFRLVLPVQHP